MFRCRGENPAPNGGSVGNPNTGKLRFRSEGPGARGPDGEPCGKRVGSSGYRLGVVGERSSGDEGKSGGLLERGEVRIPE